MSELSEEICLGEDTKIDPNVLLGYLPGREIEDISLKIGAGAHIRSGSVIYAGTSIGSGLQTGHNVIIREQNTIGDELQIWSGSIIDYGCEIGDGVRVHSNVYIAQFTTIESGVFLAPGVMIANDPHPICGLCMRGPTIKRGARIGVNVTLLPHITIGERALIGAGSVVTRDIPDDSLAYGNPARPMKSIDELPCPFELVERPYINGIDVHTRGDQPYMSQE